MHRWSFLLAALLQILNSQQDPFNRKPLTEADLADDGAIAVADALGGSSATQSLATLELEDNDIGPEGARAVASSDRNAFASARASWASSFAPWRASCAF